jgi:hypothetical protein
MEIWKVDYFVFQDLSICQRYFYSKEDAQNFSNCQGQAAANPVLIDIEGKNFISSFNVNVNVSKKDIKKTMEEALEEMLETLKGEQL